MTVSKARSRFTSTLVTVEARGSPACGTFSTTSTGWPLQRAIERDDAALAAHIAALEHELAWCRRQQRERDDWRLLSAIVQVKGQGIFETADLFRLAPRVPALRDALTGWTPNHLGRRLMHLTNRPCGDFLVQLVERSSRGRVYTIVPRHRDASSPDAAAP